jgi:SAM-dependent methyltransferase
MLYFEEKHPSVGRPGQGRTRREGSPGGGKPPCAIDIASPPPLSFVPFGSILPKPIRLSQPHRLFPATFRAAARNHEGGAMTVWIYAVLLVFALLFAAKLLFVVSAGFVMPATQGALFVPTPRVRIEAFLEAVPMGPGDLIVDLGCGDGRVLQAVRKRYGVRARGVDINPLACLAARLRNLGDRGVRIQRGNFWGLPTGDADVVFCYLFPDVMHRMARKLERELSPGARVVSCNFPLPGWTPEAVLHPDSAAYGDPIYLYRKVHASG